jgi:hypothetical protein
MLRVVLTTLADGMAPPPGSHRLAWSWARQLPSTTESARFEPMMTPPMMWLFAFRLLVMLNSTAPNSLPMLQLRMRGLAPLRT